MSVGATLLILVLVWPLFGLLWAAPSALIHYYWGPAKKVDAQDAIEFLSFFAMCGPLAIIPFIWFLSAGIWNYLFGGRSPYDVVLYTNKKWNKS